MGVLLGGFQDAVLQSGLLQLAFGFLADFAFEIGIWGGEQAGVTGVHAGFGVVDTGTENLRGGKAQRNGASVHGNVAGLNFAEVHAGNDFTMNDE